MGDNVTSIGCSAFSGCSALTSITIPDSVTSIGGSAFYCCSSLTNVTIPASVVSIESGTFSGCSKLESAIISNKVNSIGRFAFSDCTSLKSITIPNSVTDIGIFAFSGCSSLKSVAIGNNVTSIGGGVFSGCNKLEYISVDAGNPNYISVEGVLFDKDIKTLIQYPIGNASISCEIPNDVNSIGDSAFSGCSSLRSITIPGFAASNDGNKLTSLTIPDSVTSIGYGVFEGCSKLESAIISNEVTSIGVEAFKNCNTLSQVYYLGTNYNENSDYVFENCTSLNNVTVPNDYNGRYFCGKPVSNCLITGTCGSNAKCKWILNGDTKTLTIYGTGEMTSGTWDKNSIKSVIIENGVTSIGKASFTDCTELTNVSIPASVTSIGESAFYNCNKLESISVDTGNRNYTSVDGVLFDKEKKNLIEYPVGNATNSYKIPDSVTSIEDYAFYGCSKLETVSVPNKVRFIQKYAFSHCTALNNVTVAGNLDYVGEEAFSNCIALNKFTYKGTKAPNYGEKVFDNCKNLDKISVPKNYEGGDNFCGRSTDLEPYFFDTPIGRAVEWIGGIVGIILTIIGPPSVIKCLQKCGYCRCENDKAGKRAPSSDEKAPLLNRKGPSIHDEDSDSSISEVPQVIVVPGDSSVVVGSPVIVRPSDHFSKEESRADDAVNSSGKVESSDVDEDDDSTVEEESLTGDNANSTVGESPPPTERVA